MWGGGVIPCLTAISPTAVKAPGLTRGPQAPQVSQSHCCVMAAFRATNASLSASHTAGGPRHTTSGGVRPTTRALTIDQGLLYRR